MDWTSPLALHPIAYYQLVAFPFAVSFRYLCTSGCLSLNARYVLLLVGGCLLACAAMGWYTLLLFIPTFCSVAIFHSVSPLQVHTWAFVLQMSWQTLCHLGLHYREHYLQGAPCIRLTIALSSLMLQTQKVTSLALDIHEGKVTMAAEWGNGREPLLRALPLCSYLLFFPALLGGPLCSFRRFQVQIQGSCTSLPTPPLRVAGQKCLCALALHLLRMAVRSCVAPLALMTDCTGFDCVYVMWRSALLFRLAYYSQWVLDEALLRAAGFGLELGHVPGGEAACGDLSDADIWTLETTNRIALFTRTWNRSTSRWLRRLIFQRSPAQPLLATFAFSAWWHGLHPGQVFGFLCWAAMVEADYRIHPFLRSLAKSWHTKVLYHALTWVQTQLIIAYITAAVEMRSFSALWLLGASYNSFFPLLYGVSLLWLVARAKEKSV
ncbi:membrane-bound ghrelin O-acyltransferase MBOAT4 [Chelonoidis abingdonii]|uniref:Membrane bound O-acyltransferase domain containing 4 n=1 Tax=Chelonoidis abingdonii TaxID=106734 RepID=A0A8C0H8K5_CHEAB|nr:ghrelin O-acyltransferase [Chelonoidis abingdonii]